MLLISGKLNHPTPFYNSLICQDLITLRNEEIKAEVFNNPNFKDALILLKIWLHQRKMDEVRFIFRISLTFEKFLNSINTILFFRVWAALVVI